jgi:hypothetical protein
LATTGLLALTGTAQATPHAGQSVNVAVIDGTSSINGGALPTTTTGPTGAFTDFTFTNLPAANVSTANLAPFDTAVLNVASPGMGCDVDTLTAGQKADLVTFLNAGGKLIIYDSECATQDYSWLPHPFTTANPGALGGTGTVNVVEDNFLGNDIVGDPHFIDETILGTDTDAVGDMNVLTTVDPSICLHMSGTNALQQSGATHAYYQSGSGLLIYRGFDIDYSNTGSIPDATTGDGNLAKIWLQELQQPLDGSGLACAAAVVGISLTPRNAVNPVGTTHTVTATRTDSGGNPVSGVLIGFTVSGVNAGATGTCNPADCTTDANGQVTFTYTGANAGDDQIVACFTPQVGAPVCSAAANKTWQGTAGGPYGESKCVGITITGIDLLGTDLDEVLTGTELSDQVRGREGKDKINGLGDADCLFGNADNDKINGDEGADLIRAGSGNDKVKGNDGNDNIKLQDGDDNGKGGPGDDRIKAQARGKDHVNCGSGDDAVIADRKDTIAKNCEHVSFSKHH